MPDRKKNHTVLGFDFGLKNIGVAVGQTITHSARPLTTLTAQDGAPQWQQIRKLIDEWQPDVLLVGLPLHMDGQEQDLTRAARRFANRLHGRFAIQVELVDERLTSCEAESRISDLNSPPLNDKLSIDSVSAQIIVEQWFEQGNSV